MKKKDLFFFCPAPYRALVRFGSWCSSVLCLSLTFALIVRCENYETHCLPSEPKFTRSCDSVDLLISLMQRSPGRTMSLKNKQWWNVKKPQLISALYFFFQGLTIFLFLWFVTVPHITVSYILKEIMRWYVMKNGNYSWFSTAGKQPLKTEARIIKTSVHCKEKKFNW